MKGVSSDIHFEPHPEEVKDTKWVTWEELQDMLNDSTLLFSPWFRLICHKWLKDWWKSLDNLDKYVDVNYIHEFDPPPEHYGAAKPLFLQGDDSKKQGAYGKIKIHSEPKLHQLLHLDEVMAAMTLLYIRPMQSNLASAKGYPKQDLEFCNDIVIKVSRSFAAVIQQLPSTLVVDILIFYLVLRALDTVEDDTSIPHDVKIQHLMSFHKNALGGPWTMQNTGEADERRLLEEFDKVYRVYAELSAESRGVILDITERMATGMAEFVSKDLGQGTADVKEYNRYCHFVAGLVGEGLSRLFASSGLEQASMAQEVRLSDQMGLFLQKTNIIRDYLEDFVDKRAFWPQSIWKKYSETGDLGYFVNQSDPLVREKSLECLNELVTDALELAPDCLAYMALLKCDEVFRFCAIPQVMAIATLQKCYSNSDVFTGVVKIRKGLSCKLILRTNNLDQVHATFYEFAQAIIAQANKERNKGVTDPNYTRTIRACEVICDTTRPAAQKAKRTRWLMGGVVLAAIGAIAYLPLTKLLKA
jgi:farnesyl-diphosphate farnesyltransferase